MTKYQKIRIQFIDAMFTIHGRVSTENIMDAFCVASACASRDLRAYRLLNSKVAFNYKYGSYLRRPGFAPVDGLISKTSPKQFLQTISMIFDAPNMANSTNLKPFARGGAV